MIIVNYNSILFTVAIENGEEIIKNISYILKCIYNVRFMGRSLSNLVNSLSDEIHKN